MIKGKELIFVLGIIVIMIISLFGGFILSLFIIRYVWWNRDLWRLTSDIFLINPYLTFFLNFLTFAGPIFAIAGFLGFLWYQIMKNSMQPSMTKDAVKGKTKIFLYIIILVMLILIVFGLMGGKLALQM